jgi:hypothetical protein
MPNEILAYADFVKGYRRTALPMEAEGACEQSINANYTTQCNVAVDCPYLRILNHVLN